MQSNKLDDFSILDSILTKEDKTDLTLNERFSKLREVLVKELTLEELKIDAINEDKDESKEMDCIEAGNHNFTNNSVRKQNVLIELAKKFKKRLVQNNSVFDKKFHSKDRKNTEPSGRKKCGFYRSGDAQLLKKKLDYEIDLYMSGVEEKSSKYFPKS